MNGVTKVEGIIGFAFAALICLGGAGFCIYMVIFDVLNTFGNIGLWVFAAGIASLAFILTCLGVTCVTAAILLVRNHLGFTTWLHGFDDSWQPQS